MDVFFKAVAGILISVVLVLCVQKQEKDISLLLTLSVCIMGAVLAVKVLTPVMDLLRQLEYLGQLQNGMLGVLLKIAGIGIVAELASMVCADAGNGALEKTVRLLGTVTMLSMSIPVFQTLLELIQEIMGTV